jgi:serine phosphatase RsbU (regulator of sigma subunit)/anti-sigma regulatory factor (Ser/Thr protein kinase)
MNVQDSDVQARPSGSEHQANRASVASWAMRLRRVRPHMIDAGLAVVVAVAVSIAISVTRSPGARPPDALAYVLAVTIGAVVFVRRRWPVGVLVATFFLLQVYYWTNYPSIWPAVALAVPLYTAAAAGHLRWSLAVAAWYWVIPLLVATVGFFGSLAGSLNDLVRDGSIMVAVLLFGNAVRTHRALMAEAAERLRRAEEDREREVRELSAARVIQQQLLPSELPSLPGWRIAAYYQPARAVGGDFYDFIELSNGQIAIVTGDVTDKGIPAALVMATTHSILRGDAPDRGFPGSVLERANDRLYPDIPAPMFVTCLYAVLDPVSGRLRYANAGHSLPYGARADGVTELRATGMPLGAMPGMTYEEHETSLAPGDSVLFHSDGLIEAHNPAGEMFGVPRLQQIVQKSRGSEHLIDECLSALSAFAGSNWEQEDDITLVTLQRLKQGSAMSHTLAELAVPSEPGNERRAIEAVAEAVAGIGLSQRRLERLKTAVAEATMNAMEHGNKYRRDAPVRIRVSASEETLSISITDEGSGPVNPDPQTPDLEAKLEHQQTPTFGTTPASAPSFTR